MNELIPHLPGCPFTVNANYILLRHTLLGFRNVRLKFSVHINFGHIQYIVSRGGLTLILIPIARLCTNNFYMHAVCNISTHLVPIFVCKLIRLSNREMHSVMRLNLVDMLLGITRCTTSTLF